MMCICEFRRVHFKIHVLSESVLSLKNGKNVEELILMNLVLLGLKKSMCTTRRVPLLMHLL